MERKNREIRQAAKDAHVCLWEIAEALGFDDARFSRKLRHELPPGEREKVLMVIDELAEGR